jgi:two-component system sensor histidine kinase BaeS
LLALSPTARLGDGDRQDLADVVEQAQYLEQLVADLSLLARSDENRLPPNRQRIPLADVVGDAARAARILSHEKGLIVEESSPPDLIVSADPVRIKELMLVLVENAVAHTPDAGAIKISAEAEADAVTISVEDTGPGIPAADLPRVFGRFYRGDGARSRDGGGTGLGLSIAQAIAVAHGGHMEASNAKRGGAKITVRLPRAGG